LPSTGVSKSHATIVNVGHSMMVIDQNSANGVFVNGKRIDKHVLRYWDEIQIFNYVIKYMAVARLPGEQQGAYLDGNTESRDQSTKEFSIASVKDLAKLRKDKRIPHLSLKDSSASPRIIPLDAPHFSIGSAKNCDMRIRGWFVPRKAADIQRRTNGFYLVRRRRGKVVVNEKPIRTDVKLNDGDDVIIHRRQFKFYYRPVEKAA
jgi:pSer/pThr/pTyr-binding forkhead associated (FHA) protein